VSNTLFLEALEEFANCADLSQVQEKVRHYAVTLKTSLDASSDYQVIYMPLET
jgi:hypothetical protein